MFDARAFIKNLTSRTGVYCMQDKTGQVIYVGKAKNLKKRVASYFNRARANSLKVCAMVGQVDNIETIVTHTENEALILENNLIKSHKPRYNVCFRDDKSYPYLYLSTTHPYPLFRYHRGSLKKKGQYFGPYPGAASVKRTLNLIQKLFQVRSCEDSVFANRSRPCLQYQIKRCSAPCVGYISEEDYARDIRYATLFLEGKNEAVIKSLTEPMQRASDRLEFELAVRFRDQIRALRDIQQSRNSAVITGDLDVIACTIHDNRACIQRMFIRSGHNLGSRACYPKYTSHQTEADMLRAFVGHFYLNEKQQRVSPEIIISHPFEDIGLMEMVLSDYAGKKVSIKASVRGERAKWLRMAIENADLALKQRLASNKNQRQRFKALRELLGIDEAMEQIECFDISHSHGEATVGSCVVFGADGPLNSNYRQFNIEGIKRGDDYAAISQVVRRRYMRLVKEEAKLPDLVLIDGGKGQIGVARKALCELQLAHIPILGVAKGPTRKPGMETLILAFDNKTINYDNASPALHLIQHIRDEAHRFAIGAHRQRRQKQRHQSGLETIAGIGSRRRQNLIRHFGGLQGVVKAGVDELVMAPGISKNLARKIYTVFHHHP